MSFEISKLKSFLFTLLTTTLIVACQNNKVRLNSDLILGTESSAASIDQQLSSNTSTTIGDFNRDQMSNIQDLTGIYQSNGYGYILDLRSEGVRIFDIYGDFCLGIDKELEPIRDYYDLYRHSHDGQSTYITYDYSGGYEYEYRSLSELPKQCRTKPDNTPLNTFDAFAEVFAEHYAFFPQYNVDWQDVTSQARAKITPQITDSELLEILKSTLVDIKDGHVTIESNVNGIEDTYYALLTKTYQAAEAQAKKLNASADELMDRLLSNAWHEQITQKILKDKRTSGGNGIIQYGVTSDNIGYLSILSMSNHGDNFNADNIYDAMDMIDLVMEDAMKKLADTKAVIVDVSLNDGGDDAIARKFATYFTDRKTFVYSKEAGDAQDRPRHDLYIEPNDDGRYLNPVYMLTSDVTASAAEIFVMSMRALPHVTHVGETTTGALSDTLDKSLPNGWLVSLSNEIYLDSQDQLWESKGIPPEIQIPVFDPDDIFQGHYEAVTQVIQEINDNYEN